MSMGTLENGLALNLQTGVAQARRTTMVYHKLIDAIRTHRIGPGHRLREEDIAQSMGLSRTPVREALQILQARRLVEVMPGSGIVVSRLDYLQIAELFDMRDVLEGMSARFAAQHASDNEISVLKALHEQFELATATEELCSINAEFHRCIYQAAKNRYVMDALTALEDSLSLIPGTVYSIPERRAAGVLEHKAIIHAIASRDADAAERASRLHIREAQRARLAMTAALPSGTL